MAVVTEDAVPLHPGITARLYTDRKCFGPGVAMLLRRIGTFRSLRSAAQDMGMAYSKAWTILREAERGLGFPLLRTSTGGAGGGGTVLTEQGVQMLEAYDAFERELKAQGDMLFQKYFGALLEAYGSAGE